ncbi:MAG: metallophosphoesterase [Chitinophagales bacterium]
MIVLLQKMPLRISRALCSALIVLSLSTHATEYVPMGSTWKYKDDGSNQGTAWRASGFNDASWSSGPAQLGFGDSDEATVIADVNQYTTYFRTTFTVADASIYGTLDLEMIRDDGAVVYLNGVEIWRDNMPTGTINYNTTAPTYADPENGIYTTTVSSANLVSGTNTLAVEVHQNDPSSSDVSFDFSLTAVLAEEGISFGSSWKYLDNGSNQGTAWRASGFNDASWSSGNAELGFGDGDETTVVADNNQYTTYFRKQFNIADTSDYESLNLEMIRDDGAVVYLNGTEVWRDNMPTGTINYNTVASSNISGSAETTIHTTSIASSFLVNGTNTIAVEVHQDNPSSSDVSFDFALTPQEAAPYIDFGSVWKYLDNGSNQGTAWRASGFNDASWSSGSAELGYGDGDEATTVSYGGNSSNKYVTTYFRKSFSATGFSSSDYFELSLIRDDGAVVYLNGTEIFRDNMPEGTVTYTTLAASNISGSEETTPTTLLLPATDFISGTNVIAVEMHQDNVTSSDISMDMQLINVGTPELTFERGPYLQTLTQSSVIVKWRTGLPIGSFVAYGSSPGSLTDTVYDATVTFDHEVTVGGLNTDTKYFYSIGNGDTTFAGGDADHFFITAPESDYTGLTRAWVLGDAGTANNNQRDVRDAYYNYVGTGKTDMILMLGDNAYDNGTDAEYQYAMFEGMYEDIIRQTVTWSCPGNHDIYSANSSTQTGPYYDIFTFPKAGEAGGLASGTEAYYSWDYGQIHFVSLDSDDSDRSTGGSMLTWLTNDLAATTKKWIVVIFHHPPYTKGSHDSDNTGDSGGRMRDMREDVLPILESYGVDLVLSGHSHSYERSYFLNGHYDVSSTFNSSMQVDAGSGKLDVDCSYKKETTGPDAGKGAVYITAGSSGKVTGSLTAHPAMYAYLYQMGSVIVEIEESRMDVKFLNNTGNITDYFTIDKDINNSALDTTITSGNSITLTASWADDFVWSPGGATTQSITVSPTDTTQYIVTNAAGCLADTFNVNVDAPLVCSSTNEASTANFDFGSEWRYDDSGADLGTAWKDNSFVDTCWTKGDGKFGFGDTPSATTTLNNHLGATYYFRKHFDVSDVSEIEELAIDLVRDDGAIVYVNGTEVYRSNMGLGIIAYDDLATSNVSGAAETVIHSFTIPSANLLNGENVLAVEVHQDNTASSDIGFDMKSTIVDADVYSWSYETISGKVFLDIDFNRTYSAGDYGSGALVLEAYQDKNANGILDYGDALVSNTVSGIDGSYQLDVYPSTIPAVSVSPLSSNDDALENSATGAVAISGSQVLSADVSGSSVTLLDTSATWKYYDSGYPSSNWYNIGYDDSGWSSGNGNFGFGDGGENTQLTSGQTAYYFRKEFTISGPDGPNYEMVLANVRVDDGIVIYMNGVEVARQNMPDGVINHGSLAVTNINYLDERSYTSIQVPNPGLVSGTNTVAVEIHQDNVESSDMHFAMELKAYDIHVDELGLRFNNVQVPNGAVIIDAWVTMKAANASTGSVIIEVEGEAADHALSFNTTSYDISDRERTTNNHRAYSRFPILNNEDYNVTGLGSIIGEIVSRPGWSSGNSLALFLKGFTNNFYTNDGGESASLVIAYVDTNQTSVDYIINIKEESLPETKVFMTEQNPIATISKGARAASNVNIGYLGTTSMCVAAADDFDDLHVINRFNGANTYIGGFGGTTRSIEAIALSYNADSLFAVDGDSLGLVDLTTGAFNAYGTRIGSGTGSLGSYTFLDIDGLAYDSERNILWATERREGAPDLLLVIDHTTGLLVEDYFGAGVDYLVTSGAGLLNDIDDIAVNPNTGNLFAMNNNNGTITNLIEIDPATGVISVINSTGLNDMEGQGFHNDGKFYSTSGRIGTPSNVFYEVDTATASLTAIGHFSTGGDFEGCDCKSGPYISFLEGIVFSDLDENGIFDGVDVLDDSVTVYLYEDTDGDSIITVADSLISSTLTDSLGSYFFGVNRKGVFLVDLEMADIPEGSTLTTPAIQEARFTSTGNFDSDNDFGYRNAFVLPVEFASFYGEHVEGVNHLYWTTLSEINNSHFNIFRSKDGVYFEAIGRKEGAGNSNNMLKYNFQDRKPLLGENYYRLQQVDYDGTSEYSKIIVLTNNGLDESIVISAWPNPADNEIYLSGIRSLMDQNAKIRIIDIFGNVQFANDLNINGDKATIDTRDLKNGYFLIEISTEKSKYTIPFIKQKN